jgi:hypothetical protein
MTTTTTTTPTTTTPTTTTSGAGKAKGKGITRWIEDRSEGGVDRVWRVLRRRPYLGVAAAAGAAFALATALGPVEIAFAAGAGYAAYLTLKKGEPPSQAVKDALRVESEIG